MRFRQALAVGALLVPSFATVVAGDAAVVPRTDLEETPPPPPPPPPPAASDVVASASDVLAAASYVDAAGEGGDGEGNAFPAVEDAVLPRWVPYGEESPFEEYVTDEEPEEDDADVDDGQMSRDAKSRYVLSRLMAGSMLVKAEKMELGNDEQHNIAHDTHDDNADKICFCRESDAESESVSDYESESDSDEEGLRIVTTRDFEKHIFYGNHMGLSVRRLKFLKRQVSKRNLTYLFMSARSPPLQSRGGTPRCTS